jgi:hypothetical protein
MPARVGIVVLDFMEGFRSKKVTAPACLHVVEKSASTDQQTERRDERRESQQGR